MLDGSHVVVAVVLVARPVADHAVAAMVATLITANVMMAEA